MSSSDLWNYTRRSWMIYWRVQARIFLLAVTLIAGSSQLAAEESGNELVLLTWADYIDPSLVEKFEREHRVRLHQIYFESDDLRDEMMLVTNGMGYDLMLVNGIGLDTYRKQGWLVPLTEQEVPNLKFIEPRWRNAFSGSDGFAIPYFWGTLGIGYRRDLLQHPPQSWMDLFKPGEALRGKITVLDSQRDAIGMALKALGFSANSGDDQEIRQAVELLLKQKPYVHSYGYLKLSAESALVTGEVSMAMLFNGDALMLREFNNQIDYVVPKEGCNLWVDYLTVSSNSTRKNLAYAFIDFLNQPENAAQLAAFVNYPTPNLQAKGLLPSTYFDNPIIYPPMEILNRCEFYKPLPTEAIKTRNTQFVRVMQ